MLCNCLPCHNKLPRGINLKKGVTLTIVVIIIIKCISVITLATLQSSYHQITITTKSNKTQHYNGSIIHYSYHLSHHNNNNNNINSIRNKTYPQSTRLI